MVLAVILSIVLMVIDQRYHQLQQVRSTLAIATYPLHFLADLPVTASLWLQEMTAARSKLMADNEKLRGDNLKMQAELQKYQALQSENLRLRDLLDSSFKVGDRVLVAELSAVDLDPYKQQVVINKGSASGAFKGQPVLDANAVMGQVTQTTPFSSTVLLITDASHSMPVQVLRNGLRTLAVGSGRINQLNLPYLPTNSDIQEGDLLVTSGLGGKFPSGYPVASVTKIDRSADNAFATITAKPAAHLDRSREVLLVWTVDNGIQAIPKETEATPPASEQKEAQ